jgi:hypothetical protein
MGFNKLSITICTFGENKSSFVLFCTTSEKIKLFCLDITILLYFYFIFKKDKILFISSFVIRSINILLHFLFARQNATESLMH